MFASIDGGFGTDTLAFSGYMPLINLSDLTGKISNIEIIDLTGYGAHSLTLSLTTLTALSSTSDTLRVDGDSNDAVSLAKLSGQNVWAKSELQLIGSINYYFYTSEGARLQVASSITTTIS